MADTFPRQHARTQRLTLGEPRSFLVAHDGRRAVFARSRAGNDPVNTLWRLDTASGAEHEILDPRALGGDGDSITPEERRRRERAREGAGGVVTCAADAALDIVVTVLAGQPVIVSVADAAVTLPDVAPGVFDARPSPDGARVAWVRDGALCVWSRDAGEKVLVSEETPGVTWGLAEFIAAEEMGRHRGHWWSPDSRLLAVCRVDDSPVPKWHIADPSRPDREPETHRYPAAGAANALVTLHIVDVDTGARTAVELPGTAEYLTSVSWTATGLIAQVQSRDQRRVDVVRIEPADGATEVVFTDTDDAWVELVPGVPTLDPTGRLVTCADRDDARRLVVDGTAVTPADLQVRHVVSVGDEVVFIANDRDTPWIHDAWSWGAEGLRRLTDEGGVVSAGGHGGCLVVRTARLDEPRARIEVRTATRTVSVNSHAEQALVDPRPEIVTVGASRIPVALLRPSRPIEGPLPVLFDPYGGPHAQRVVASRNAHATSQWFADQGFLVVVADGAGTPGRGSAVERAVHGDLAAPVLADQVAVLEALPGLEPRADLSRVAIRGWSFGGYLAALAVLRRGDLFHAAVAGAPVTDWRLYDTHYTERYLGDPGVDDAPYVRTSLLVDAHRLERALLLIHGLADDNVVAAHTLQLSAELLAAGRDHEVLPLSGVTHMTPQEVVAENLLLHQLAFLRRALGIDAP